MAKPAVDCRNMVRVKVRHTHTTGYSKITVNVLYAYFITGCKICI